MALFTLRFSGCVPFRTVALLLLWLLATSVRAASPSPPVLYFAKANEGFKLKKIVSKTRSGSDTTYATAAGMRALLAKVDFGGKMPISLVMPAGSAERLQLAFAGPGAPTGPLKAGDSQEFHPLEGQEAPTYELALQSRFENWNKASTRKKGDVLKIDLQFLPASSENATVQVVSVGEEETSTKGLTLAQWTYNGTAAPEQSDQSDAQAGATPPPADAPATREQTLKFLRENYTAFQEGQVLRMGTTIYLFLNRALQVAPGTAWPSCNEQGVNYQVVVVDKPAKDIGIDNYQLNIETSVVRDPNLRIDAGGGAAQGVAEVEVAVLAEQTITARTGTLLLSMTLGKKGEKTNLTRQSFRLPDCDLAYHVGILLGVNASFLSTPTNIATWALPNTTDYTLVADDPTTHQALTVMAIFYPTPRRYGYEYKELSFFQKFNVSVGSQVGPSLLSDVLLGLNYEVARGLSFGAGGHYGRHRTIIGQPDFRFGKDVYAGGSTFTEATNTRMQWDLAWYVGLGIDLRVIGILSGRDREVRDLRNQGSGPITPAGGTASTTVR